MGIVMTQDISIARIVDQLSLRALLKTPTPTMAPATVCVVETGILNSVAASMAMAAPVSAAQPRTGFKLVIFVPMVRTIRQPPVKVPNAMAKWHVKITQVGTKLGL